ncbi:septum formation family protein [Cellulomonas sp. zg-ZUI199]|uniref:Septum formation family protein n=1 Tax=Cellulomonas wangleii TaxID=2816956 RepID=A0ABX8D301_9CELL|nr:MULTISPECIES: septum formation family protein [Cellulomonas]MBO0899211.1 septum formation family protein [Cellulomonas sp. zg-ZUI22]MBO0923510.1 septum formation family protein [Cellulomonas wangleii]QVI61850.1 septum formation family protein [Cellulomonas wangleii]
MGRRTATRRPRATALVGAALLTNVAVAGCAWFGDDGTNATQVLDLAVGDCVVTPDDVQAELTDVTTVACDAPHQMEVYALVPDALDGPEAHPGVDALAAFADGVCAERFAGYVGVDYRDSDLFLTYLLPSARGWSEGDTTVTCLVTTTGEQLIASVAGSGR